MQKERQIMQGMILAALFAALTAVAAQVKIPLSFTPVPITLQTLMVLLSGAMLGARYGALSQFIYLVLGAAGLPVFAGGSGGIASLFGPTGGYLFSYPIAAFIVGYMTESKGIRKSLKYAPAAILLALVLLAYIDIVLGFGIIKLGLGQGIKRTILLASLTFIAVLFLVTLYLIKKSKIDANAVLAMFAGTLIIYVMGSLQAKIVLPELTWQGIFAGWVLPFIIGDTVKLLIAAYLSTGLNLKRYLR